jgi:hypothetical protein
MKNVFQTWRDILDGDGLARGGDASHRPRVCFPSHRANLFTQKEMSTAGKSQADVMRGRRLTAQPIDVTRVALDLRPWPFS